MKMATAVEKTSNNNGNGNKYLYQNAFPIAVLIVMLILVGNQFLLWQRTELLNQATMQRTEIDSRNRAEIEALKTLATVTLQDQIDRRIKTITDRQDRCEARMMKLEADIMRHREWHIQMGQKPE